MFDRIGLGLRHGRAGHIQELTRFNLILTKY